MVIKMEKDVQIVKNQKGETEIQRFLIDNCIKFESQKKFDGCKSINHLLFDFLLARI